MAESILVTGKKISSMELVTDVIGNEKIPTGQPDDLAVTPNQIADHTIARGDLASQEDLSQVEVSLGTQITDLESDVNASNNSIRGLIAAEEAARIAGDSNLQIAIDAEVAARIAADDLKVDKEGSVTSVAGRVGDVVLTPSDVLVEGFGSQEEVNKYVVKPFLAGEVYGVGDRVRLENGDVVKSVAELNTTNPNSDMAEWEYSISDALTTGFACVEWFGDTTIDATNAINMCLIYCANYGKVAKSISGKEYPLTSTVRISTNCDFEGSLFSLNSAFAGAAIEVMPRQGASGLLSKLNIRLPRLNCNKSGGTPPVAGSVGVRFESIRDSTIHYSDVLGFENNILLYSNSGSQYVSYVNFYGGTGLLAASKVNVHMLVEDSGWVNECKFFGGHWGEFSEDRARYDAINLKFTKLQVGGNNGPNGHCFFGVSMEGAFSRTIDYDYNPALSTTYNSNNTFFNCRLEQAKEIRYNRYSLSDTFIGCSGILGVDWVDGGVPNIIAGQGIFNHVIQVAAIPGNVGFRSSLSSHLFRTANSNGSLALGVKLGNFINGGLLANGSYVLFNNTLTDREHPVVKISHEYSTPGIAMGNGVDAPTSRLTFYTDTQWRHNFDLCPSTTGDRNLGASALRYNTVYARGGNFSSGIGLYGSAPPTVKPVVTGKITPTTVAEQNAVIDSIISALTKYGLVSDGRSE